MSKRIPVAMSWKNAKERENYKLVQIQDESVLYQISQLKHDNDTTKTNSHTTVFGLDFSSRGLSILSPSVLLFKNLTTLKLSQNFLHVLPEFLFDIKTLTSLDVSSNYLKQLPKAIGQLVFLQHLALDSNQLTTLPLEMGRLFRLKIISVDKNPITTPPAHIIEGGGENIIAYLRDHMPVGNPPPERRFVSYLDPQQLVSISDNNRVKVMSYNVLANIYASEDRYFYCPSWALDWNYRRKGLLNEISASRAEIICLQEVEMEQYHSFFLPGLSKHGYAGTFAPKSRYRNAQSPQNVDGCAIFYLKSRFQLIEEHKVEFQNVAMMKHKESGMDAEAFSRLVTKDNIALVTIFQVKDLNTNNTEMVDGTTYYGHHSKQEQSMPFFSPTKKPPSSSSNSPPKYLLISNTHIHWNPQHKDVKLIQVQMLMEQLSFLNENFTRKYVTMNKNHRIPMVVCGDFNSLTDSGPYELVQKGKLQAKHPDLEPFNYGSYSTDGFGHSLDLSSAYSQLGEPPFTNYTGDFVGILDYLFYTKKTLGVSKVLQPVDEETVKWTRLPNAFMYSDHILIMSEFYFL